MSNDAIDTPAPKPEGATAQPLSRTAGYALPMQTVMTAELRVDCYDGPECDQHRKYWNGYAEGDKQDEAIDGDLVLSAAQFPPGTRIRIESPACPTCHETQDTCRCGFDWKGWVEGQYA